MRCVFLGASGALNFFFHAQKTLLTIYSSMFVLVDKKTIAAFSTQRDNIHACSV